MAIKQTPMGLLAQMIGEAAGLGARTYRQEQDVSSLGNLYQQQFGYEPRAAKAMARDPRQAQAFMRVEAARNKRQQKEQQELSEEEKKRRKKQQAVDLIKMAKQANSQNKEAGKISKAFGRFSKRFLGGDPNEEKKQAIYNSLNKNEAIKELDIALPRGTDDPEISEALLDNALLKLGVLEGEAVEKDAIQQDIAEDELDTQDVASQATPELNPNAPVDDIEQDEHMDSAAMQMQQEIGEQTPPPPQGPEQGAPQPIQKAEPYPQRESGYADKALNLGKQAAAGLYSGATLPVRALEAIKGYINPDIPETQEQQADYADIIRRQRRALGLPEADDTRAIEQEQKFRENIRKQMNLPTREDAYKFLGGKEEQSLFAKSVNEFVGDVAEQLPLAALTGAFSTVAKIPQALRYIGLTQGAGNMAKWLSKEAGESDNFANNAKIGASLLTALGFAPTLKNVATNTEKAAENALPEFARATVKNDVFIKEAAWDLNQALNSTEAGLVKREPLQMLQNIVNNNQRVNYKDALQAIRSVEESATKLSPSSSRLLEIFKDRVMNDISSNAQVPNSVVRMFEKAQEMLRNVNNSTGVLEWLNSLPLIGKAMKADGLGAVVGLGMLTSFRPTAGIVGTGLYGVKKGIDLAQAMYLFSTSAGMRDYYFKMMNAAFQYNGAEATKYLFNLNKAIEQKTKKKK